ncbi:MAG: sulfatase [Planctomycetota bacterium]|nr:sulfatase [Planctomycetota bacterium]
MFRLPCVMLFFFFIITPTVKAASALEKPNILFILIDDLGWMDLEFQGNQLVDTPALNRFAKQGIRFTDAYAAAPVCSPTRAAIMTGLFPARLKITNHIPDQPRFIPDEPKVLPADMLNYLPSERITVAELLKNAGYSTAFLGKWHLSGTGRGEAKWEPTAQGFDLNIGGCAYGGPPTFFDPYRIPNLPDRQQGEYLPDRLADEAINYMKKADGKPFFLCLWNYTVHWPMEAPEELLKKYKGREGDGLNDTRYGAMIEAMDRSMGRILEFLEDTGLSENTLVVFTSDNGGFGGVADNRPLRAEKGYLYEGGIRVPLVVRWPGVVSPETIESTPVISTDFFPTLLEAASVKVPETYEGDGVSLLPLLKMEEDNISRDSIFFHYPNYAFHRSNRLGSAVRRGDHKLIEWLDDGSVELYNLAEDLQESRDLSDEKPLLAEQMLKQLHEWRLKVDAEMPKAVSAN